MIVACPWKSSFGLLDVCIAPDSDRTAAANNANIQSARRRPPVDLVDRHAAECDRGVTPFHSMTLSGAGEQHRWDFNAERLRGLEIYQLKLGRLLHGQIAWVCSIQYLLHAIAPLQDLYPARPCLPRWTLGTEKNVVCYLLSEPFSCCWHPR
jgi:hypothetical protein